MNATEAYRVKPGHKVRLEDHSPDDTGPFEGKDGTVVDWDKDRKRLLDLQERLYAEGKRSLLIILQGMDTSGKDGTVSHVMGGVNPQGVQVTSFGAPSAEELAHDYLWRVHQAVPRHGRIGIFNRSHYEDVLAARVRKLVPEKVWQARYRQITEFEQMLVANGTPIVKFYLHIDKDEQKKRLQARLDDPAKNWKFNIGDLDDRKLWDAYMQAYEDALNKCSTQDAPWYIVPANHKWYRNYVVMRIVVATLEDMNPQFPLSPEGLEQVVIDD